MSVVVVREAEYSPEDVAALQSIRRERNANRGPHGFTIAEATDPKNEGKFDVGLPRRDFAMTKLRKVQDAYFASYPSAKGDPALIWDVKKRD